MADELKVSVEKLVYGGDGLAHTGDQTVFLPFVLPGEEVRAEAVKTKKKLVWAKALEILKPAAERTKALVQGRFKQPIETQIVPAGPFYKAEDYHQDYYVKNPVRYKFYRFNCGRDARLEELWGKKE